MNPPSPRHPLPDAYAEAVYRAAFGSAVTHGIWRGEYVIGLELLARLCSQYTKLAARLPSDDAELASLRALVREQLFQFYLVDSETAPPLRSDEIDADIARLCGIPPWPIPPGPT